MLLQLMVLLLTGRMVTAEIERGIVRGIETDGQDMKEIILTENVDAAQAEIEQARA